MQVNCVRNCGGGGQEDTRLHKQETRLSSVTEVEEDKEE